MKKIYHHAREEVYAWLEAILGMIPGRFGKYFRSVIYGIIFKQFRGKKFTIGQSCQLWFPWNMEIGCHSHVSRNCQIAALKSKDVKIGDYVMIGPYSMITSIVHSFYKLDEPIKSQGITSKPIIIGDNCWIGGHSCILPGVCIGEGVIIGAGSVVTKDVPAFTIAAGVPAKIIKKRSIKSK